MARQEISLLARFKILKRDHFTCMYCGGRPPYVKLHVDHVVAVARGGGNGHRNLISACSDCNLGKSDSEYEHPRPDGLRYKPMSACECPRPTCGGPDKGRDAAELDCQCTGCHDCDICGSVCCDRRKFSTAKIRESIAEAYPYGCYSVESAYKWLEAAARNCNQDTIAGRLREVTTMAVHPIRSDLKRWISGVIEIKSAQIIAEMFPDDEALEEQPEGAN